ncbi:hypothetical protein HDE_10618 [Halotydeus destructor]|nr:hypothetical protein HDE_10618 [Halotydeus destructor]
MNVLDLKNDDAMAVGSPLEMLSNAAAAILETSLISAERERQQQVNNKLQSGANNICDLHQAQDSSNCSKLSSVQCKELPTTLNKMKRSKDRRELNVSCSPRLKRTGSPQSVFLDDGPTTDIIREQLMAPYNALQSVSQVHNQNLVTPDTTLLPHLSNYLRDRSNSTMTAYRGSPYDHESVSRRNSDPAAAIISTALAQQRIDEEHDDDQPLDFSKKSRNNSSESESRLSLPRSDESSSPISYTPPHQLSQQMMRPSVITRAPSVKLSTTMADHTIAHYADRPASGDALTIRSHQMLHKEPAPHHQAPPTSSLHHLHHHHHVPILPPPLPPPSYAAHQEALNRKNNNGSQTTTATMVANNDNAKKPEKSFADANTFDPVIEEHFRRSLGEKYDLVSKHLQQPSVKRTMSNNSATGFTDNDSDTVPDSVDDHFIKALGSDYLRLKNKEKTSSEVRNKQSDVMS